MHELLFSASVGNADDIGKVAFDALKMVCRQSSLATRYVANAVEMLLNGGNKN